MAESSDQFVDARPYPHQVGGHGELAVTNSGHVLKPLQPKEYAFYKYIHSDQFPVPLRWILQFTPKFYGEADFPNMPSPRHSSVTEKTQIAPSQVDTPTFADSFTHGSLSASTSTPSCTTVPTISTSPKLPLSTTHTVLTSSAFTCATTSHISSSKTPTLSQSTSTPVFSTRSKSIDGFDLAKHSESSQGAVCTDQTASNSGTSSLAHHSDPLETVPTLPATASMDTLLMSGTTLLPNSALPRWRLPDGTASTEVGVSPWVLQMRLRTRLSSSENPLRKPRRSIALEDINRKFVLPCVMDCKLGTRHYDDDATAEKRRRHIEKANSTTSAKCGVRYTGMQSFKRSAATGTNGVFEFRDKYDGRKLKEADLIPEATWFFYDNFQVRVECVRLILERLCELRRYLLSQNHFYFYSSSLLLVYEGALDDVAPARVDVRMIDFAHTVLSKGNRDDGYLLGINYLIRILTNVLSNERDNTRQLPERAKKHNLTNNPSEPDCYGPFVSTSQPELLAEHHEQQHDQNEDRNLLQVRVAQLPLLPLHEAVQKETTACHNDVLP